MENKKLKYNDVESITKVINTIQNFHKLKAKVCEGYTSEFPASGSIVLPLYANNVGVDGSTVTLKAINLFIVFENIENSVVSVKSLVYGCNIKRVDIEKLLMAKLVVNHSIFYGTGGTEENIDEYLEKAKDILSELKDYEFYVVHKDSILA